MRVLSSPAISVFYIWKDVPSTTKRFNRKEPGLGGWISREEDVDSCHMRMRGRGGEETSITRLVVVVAFFTLTDRALTIPSNILRGCQSDTWFAEWTGKDHKREHENKNKT